MHPPGCHTGLEAVFTISIFSTFLGGALFALTSPSYIYHHSYHIRHYIPDNA
jgi:hypothetical protein